MLPIDRSRRREAFSLRQQMSVKQPKHGSKAYVANQGRGLRIINVSNPHVPPRPAILIRRASPPVWWCRELYAYVANGDKGLRIVNVGTPSAPYQAVGFSLTGYI